MSYCDVRQRFVLQMIHQAQYVRILREFAVPVNTRVYIFSELPDEPILGLLCL